MGVIKRQGLKSTIVNYIGVIIGAIAVLRIYPLDREIYGYAQWLYSTAYLLLPIATGGLLSLLVKYFPSYSKDDKEGYNGLLTLLLSGLIVVFSAFVLSWFLFRDRVVAFMEKAHFPNTSIIPENEGYLLGLLGCLILLRFLVNQSWNGLRTVVPDIVEKLGYKLFLPALVLVYVFVGLSKEQFAKYLIGFFIVAILIMVIYLRRLDILKFGKIKQPAGGDSYREMGRYSLFSSLNLIGATLSVRLDSIMIPLLLDMAKNGSYGMTMFIANVLEMPTRSIRQISSPIIAKAWEENDLAEIKMIYKKSATNLFLLGGLAFLGIWYILDDLVQLSANPAAFEQVRPIFLLLGSAKLIDMLTSVNSQILVYSKDYKWNLLFLLLLAVANIYMNIKFIPIYDLTGAALATAISIFLYNLVKTVFLYVKYGMQPFSIANVKVFFLIGAFMLIYRYLPDTDLSLVNLLYKGAFVGLTYLAIAYFWRVSDDANEMGINLLKRLRF